MTEEEKLFKQYMDLIGPGHADWVKVLAKNCSQSSYPIEKFNEDYANQLNWGKQLKLIKEMVSKKEGDALPDLPLSTEQMFDATQKYKELLPSLIWRKKIKDTLLLRPLWKSSANLFSKTVEETAVVRNEYQMIYVPAGELMMGALPNDGKARDHEKPRHQVKISQPFWLGKYSVTQALYESVMGRNPSHHKGPTHPVEQVCWFDAILFCNMLSEREGLDPVYVVPLGLEEACKVQDDYEDEIFDDLSDKVTLNRKANGYRLPTEAEWEYAARCGTEYLYAGSNIIDTVAWYDGNNEDKTHPVGQKEANGFGLYDMSGNVWEWVWDWKSKYGSSSQTDPVGPNSGAERVYRGGSWGNSAWLTRVSSRFSSMPSLRTNRLGFRLARSRGAIPQPPG